MMKRSKKRAIRLRNLITICTLIAIILSAATYAWFIGMRTVNVSSFDVEIASTDSLLLSLDGENWDTTVNISQENFSEDAYTGNTNNWGGAGLIPVSSIGEIDTTVSRMKLFEKANFTPSPGGYRIASSRVENTGATEKDGYVAFDLFVRNFSGTQYFTDLNELNEEAIYLTVDSEVNVAVGGVKNTGIENSVRVAFAQIGRVIGTTATPATITGISCTGDANVTSICNRTKIWEPNDKAHVINAIRWYNKSCVARVAENVIDPESYEGNCMPVINGVTYPTYAISNPIAASDNIDIYDGAEYNTYAPEVSDPLLVSHTCFTDSDKQLTGTSRPQFMSLAPNSITKIRVYIYIEGQDIDNYDFASIGKKISVKFGFTKERFTEDDIQYDGPNLNQGEGPLAADQTVPVITLAGANPLTITLGTPYEELGATAKDTVDGDIEEIDISGTVNHTVAGTYTIVYKATDEAGNVGVKTRTVIVTE